MGSCLEQGVLAAGHDQAEEQDPQVSTEATVQCQKAQEGNQNAEQNRHHVLLHIFSSVQNTQRSVD